MIQRPTEFGEKIIQRLIVKGQLPAVASGAVPAPLPEQNPTWHSKPQQFRKSAPKAREAFGGQRRYSTPGN